ncbi:hypothetical protein Glove_680g63 [Diversispora epigaea]|uniref:Cation efflux protein cytoplasmic domain-containing protein n=1 Tax=Diversispora epigaea TaxID=1348612 RepID=A0A397G6W9_9GLOM|nr:hypothetical protein Glove_680g63 [Diversispora epigaea]
MKDKNKNNNDHCLHIENISDDTSALPESSDSPTYSSLPIIIPYHPYHDNSSAISIGSNAPLLYTTFDGPDDDDKCGSDDEWYNKEGSSKRSEKKLWIAIGISLFFFCLELSGGFIAGSLALLSDSFHLLSDIVSFAISLLSIYLARRPATKSHSYGFHRAEILGALTSIVLIWILTGFLCVEAYDRIKNPKEVDGETMCFVASIGVVVNILLIFVLGHEHSHGHDSHCGSHGQDVHDSHEHGSHTHGENVNVRAAFLHVLGDLLSSIGVLISSIAILFDQKNTWVDPLCTFFFSALVMATTFGILKNAIRVLMEATPSRIDAHAVQKDLESIDGVKNIHDLHIWDLTLGRTALTAHLRLHAYNPDERAEPYVPSVILSEARRRLRRYKILSVTIQIDS